jgi:uroporphyrinogen III methyltransferase/synthase
MIDAARQGKRVVRLKGGDPFVFGRGGEEAEALREAHIPFEIVPGITAAVGAAACTEIPLTHRLHASAVAFIAGHEDCSKQNTALDWTALARFPGTLVVYMGFAKLHAITAKLIAHGKDAHAPAALIHMATTGAQRTVRGSLAELAGRADASGIRAPSVLIIGDVVGIAPEESWLEKRPLFGKRVLVTRPRCQSASLLARFQELGAIGLVLPALEITPPADWKQVDATLAHLREYQWLVLTSANGVHSLFKRLRDTGLDIRSVGHLRIAAIGPATAEALRAYWLVPDVVPADFRSEALAAALRENVSGRRVLLARADRGRDVLRNELAAVAEVNEIVVYT